MLNVAVIKWWSHANAMARVKLISIEKYRNWKDSQIKFYLEDDFYRKAKHKERINSAFQKTRIDPS